MRRTGMGETWLAPGTTPGTLWPNFHALAAATPNVTYDVSGVSHEDLLAGNVQWRIGSNGVATAYPKGANLPGGALGQYGTYILIGGGLLLLVALMGSRK